MFASDDLFWISWKQAAKVHVSGLRHTKEVTVVYVTVGTRIRLYRYPTGWDKANYCDTDSVIHIQPRDEPSLIETEERLGDMTSELRPKIIYPYL